MNLDGLILSKLLNDAVVDTIDERVLNKGLKLNQFQIIENNNLLISSCKSVGISVVNIGADDLIKGTEHLILGLIWQIIRKSLLEKIQIKFHPELFRLLEPDEELESFLKLPPDQILLRWFNYHLKKANWHRQVTNFTKDINDVENYIVLLAQIQPDHCNRNALNTKDLPTRAEEVRFHSRLSKFRKLTR